MRRLLNVALVAGFLVVIAPPAGRQPRRPRRRRRGGENRDLAPFPMFDGTWQSVRRWPGLDAWFQDHFGFRSTLVRWYGDRRYFGLGVSPSPMVVRGKDGWLFYAEDGGLEDFANEHPLPPARSTTGARRSSGHATGARREASPTCSPFRPTSTRSIPSTSTTPSPADAVSRTDQVITATPDTGVVVDVRPAMLAEKARIGCFTGPTRTGTSAAPSSRISRSSTRCIAAAGGSSSARSLDCSTPRRGSSADGSRGHDRVEARAGRGGPAAAAEGRTRYVVLNRAAATRRPAKGGSSPRFPDRPCRAP